MFTNLRNKILHNLKRPEKFGEFPTIENAVTIVISSRMNHPNKGSSHNNKTPVVTMPTGNPMNKDEPWHTSWKPTDPEWQQVGHFPRLSLLRRCSRTRTQLCFIHVVHVCGGAKAELLVNVRYGGVATTGWLAVAPRVVYYIESSAHVRSRKFYVCTFCLCFVYHTSSGFGVLIRVVNFILVNRDIEIEMFEKKSC